MKSTFRIAAAALAGSIALTAALSSIPASAGSSVRQSEVRQLREAGKILSMEDILSRVRSTQPGQVVEIELDRDGGRYVYDVKLIDDADRIHKLELDATTGEVVRREKK